MNTEKLFNDGLCKIIERKRTQKELTGWFVYQELKMSVREELEVEGLDPDAPDLQAEILCRCVERMPLSIPEGSVIAGTQDDAFSPSYALINPSFRVETFAGYCDPVAVYSDIQPNEEFSKERIETVRDYYAKTKYVKNLNKIYEKCGQETKEVAYFVEPVTGHVIPDCRPILAKGIEAIKNEIGIDNGYSSVMSRSLDAAAILAERYANLADELVSKRDSEDEKERLRLIAVACRQVPRNPARELREAVQSYALLWQVMCLEQGPNPYAFSVGNLDRILLPYLRDSSKDEAIALVRHLLAFFMVGDRCWAISQNVMVGGMDSDGNDLTNDMTEIVLEAFYKSNNPQPALSVKVHRNTPKKVYEKLGEFFFTPGHSTPSLFNDESMFRVLQSKGVAKEDLADYSIAGCQEPLIMGKENANTTNSWLNLAKILELTLNDGKSLISDEKIALNWEELGYESVEAVLQDLENAFWRQFDYLLEHMCSAANDCVANLGTVPAPFSSVLQGCIESGRDMRDSENPGARYNASGCLIHGLSVLNDSFAAVSAYLENKIGDAEELLAALRSDFVGHDRIQNFLNAQDKYGNNIEVSDKKTAELASKICEKVSALRNPAGFAFQPDFSTPSTHLLYGYWVGATPDGRNARTMLGYGIDPRPGVAVNGFRERMLANKKLPFESFSGGYASHFGFSPDEYNSVLGNDAKGGLFQERVISPLFGYDNDNGYAAPFYVYFNIDEASHLRQVLEEPAKHAPSGIYIMRIHGTFVNFLDLSPAIQEDIIERLDPV